MSEPWEFVFSFRSPYAWMAARRVLPKFPADVSVRWRPFFPLPSFTNFPPIVDGKFQYQIRDVKRLAAAYELDLRWPGVDDPDWAVPHASFLHAEREGRAVEFGNAMFAARFEHGEDVASAAVIARSAESAGLDPAATVAAGEDRERCETLRADVERDYTERGIFGVPTLIGPRGTRYWGHDRIEWALREGRITAG